MNTLKINSALKSTTKKGTSASKLPSFKKVKEALKKSFDKSEVYL